MMLCFVIKYAFQNRKLIIITGSNAEHCSKRDAAPQHQKINICKEYNKGKAERFCEIGSYPLIRGKF